MSPALFAAARTSARVASSRQFSLLTSMRNVARSFEPHPFQRLPVSHASARPDYSALMKRIGGQTMVFVPAFGTIMAWPLVASQFLDGHVM
ncbi:hypothetical protein Cpir12675_004645 [Ceratocystis pirilliformis]|uniref:Uncharacterized protein n=1 Tax=Ceratocystis pirilliformis TaxID=259994 RepID=A0ABR3YW94_9PEZI